MSPETIKVPAWPDVSSIMTCPRGSKRLRRVGDPGGAMAGTQPRRWATLAAAPDRQFAYWRELICEAFLDLTPESELRDGFAGTVTQWPLGELSLARIDSQRQQVRRTDRDIARAPRTGYYANLQ